MPTVIGAASAAGIEGSARYTTPRLAACIGGAGRSQVGRDCRLESLSRREGQRKRREPAKPCPWLVGMPSPRTAGGSIVSLRLVLCSSPLQGTLSPLRVHPMSKPTLSRSVSQERIIVRRPFQARQQARHKEATRSLHAQKSQTTREIVSGQPGADRDDRSPGGYKSRGGQSR